MISVNDLYNRICSETANVLRANPKRTEIKFFIYLDSVTFHEILNDLKKTSEGHYDFKTVWDGETQTFMGHKIFVLKNTSFHLNIVPML